MIPRAASESGTWMHRETLREQEQGHRHDRSRERRAAERAEQRAVAPVPDDRRQHEEEEPQLEDV